MTFLKTTLAATAAIGLTVALGAPGYAQGRLGGGAGHPGAGHHSGGYHGHNYRGRGYPGGGYRGRYGNYGWPGYYGFGWPGFYGYYGWPDYYDYYDAYPPPDAYYPEPPLPPESPPPEQPPRIAPEPRSFVVYFPFDSAELTSQAREVVEDAARYDADLSDASLAIVGHTDAAGSDEYNQALSARRAQAVREALLANGVRVGTIDMDWRGERNQAVPTPDGAREPANRRVTIVITPAQGRDGDDRGSGEIPPASWPP